MLVSFALGSANFSAFYPPQNLKVVFYPPAKPKRKPVEYRLPWVRGIGSLRWACTFHIFCVYFICVWWPTQTQFSVEYGL